MFFKEVDLKREGWYCKLYTFVYGRTPFFNNFCPFFWLVVLAIFLLPFACLWKGVKAIGMAFSDSIDSMIERKASFEYRQAKAKKKASHIDPEDLAIAYRLFWGKDGYGDMMLQASLPLCDLKRYRKLWSWIHGNTYLDHLILEEFIEKADTNTVEEWLKIRKKRREEEDARRKAREERALVRKRIREEREARHRARLAKAIKLAKVISISLLVVVGGFVAYIVGYLLWHVVVWIVSALQNPLFYYYLPEYLLTSGVALGVIMASVAISVGIGKGTIWAHEAFPLSTIAGILCRLGRSIGLVFSTLGEWCMKPFQVVKRVGEFFVIGVKTFKADNCPAINWDDEKK